MLPAVVAALAVLVVGWVGYELSQWPPPPPDSEATPASSSGESEDQPDAGSDKKQKNKSGTPSGPWLLVGDGYAAGVGAESPGRTGYPQLLARCIGVELEVKAGSGVGYVSSEGGPVVAARTGSALERMKGSPGVVVFAAGMADREPVALVGTASTGELRKQAGQAWQQAAKSDAEVVVVGPFWPAASPDPDVEEVRKALAKEAEKRDLPFVDPSGWLDAGNIGSYIDAAGYPTPEGHAFFARKLAKELEKLGYADASDC